MRQTVSRQLFKSPPGFLCSLKYKGQGSVFLCIFNHMVSFDPHISAYVNRVHTSYREGRGSGQVKGLAHAHTATG